MTGQPDELDHLLDRMLRGVLLPEEREQLAGAVRILQARVNDQDGAASVAVSAIRLMNQAGAQRDRAEARIRELEAENAHYEEKVVGDLNEANIRLQRQAARAEATVARVRQAVDAGPVGSCCAHLIRAALNPPAGLTAEEREAADAYAAKLNTPPSAAAIDRPSDTAQQRETP